MKCAVRFCGGCNPRYDRGAALRSIKEELAGISFVNAAEGDEYDALLIIAGCSSCCASYEQFSIRGDIIRLWDMGQLPSVLRQLSDIHSHHSG